MKKGICFIFFLVIALISCEKDSHNANHHTGELHFSFLENDNMLKSIAEKLTTDSIYAAIVSISKQNGEKIFEMKEFKLYNMNGTYISTPISLTSGNYKLTDFLIVDKNYNVLFACPKKGSELSHIIENPLDISFTINKDEVTKLTPEVITASSPADFGYVTFHFEFIKTIDFLISVFVFDNSGAEFILTNATLSIAFANGDEETFQLEAKTNAVIVGDYPGNYELTVSRPGYNNYSKNLTRDELKQYTANGAGPLIVILNEANSNCNTQWFNVYGTPESDYAYSVCKSHSGGYMICGEYDNFDTDVEQLYIINTDCNGKIIREKRYNHLMSARVIKRLNNGNYIVFGHTGNYDLCLLEIDASGNIIWTKSYNENKLDFSMKNCLTVCSDEGFMIAGRTIKNNNDEIVIMKTNRTGTEQWRSIIKGESDYRSSGVLQVDDGYLIAGQKREQPWTSFNSRIYLAKLNNNGDIVWDKTYPASATQYAEDILMTSENEIFIIGTEGIGGNVTHPKLLLKKVDECGNEYWTKKYDSDFLPTHRGIIATSLDESTDGNLLLLGNTNNEQDIFIIKVDKHGNEINKNYFGVTNYFTGNSSVTYSGNDFGYQVVPTIDNGCLIAGFTNAFGKGKSDMFLLKLDAELKSHYGFKTNQNANGANSLLFSQF